MVKCTYVPCEPVEKILCPLHIVSCSSKLIKEQNALQVHYLFSLCHLGPLPLKILFWVHYLCLGFTGGPNLPATMKRSDVPVHRGCGRGWPHLAGTDLGASFAIRPLALSLPLIPLHTQLSNRPRDPSGRGAEWRMVVEDGGLQRVDGDAQNGGRDLLKCCSVIFSIVLLTDKMCFFFFWVEICGYDQNTISSQIFQLFTDALGLCLWGCRKKRTSR
jgi:hypothetical protein